MPTPQPLLTDLDTRGLIHDSTDRHELAERLEAGPITLYAGFDPTSDSLHLGNLVPLLLLRRFQLAGHVPIALAGGATGMIGDPGGRDAERVLLDAETLAGNTEKISRQLERLLDFEPGPYQARLVDNRTWTEPLGVIDFLRDVGKHMTVQQMLARDAVRSRLDRESGLSFTEFSYMLLQANDFFVLHRDEGCELQVAGSDQWGNIVSGVDLIRRRAAATVHGLVSPLITRSDGKKFGKSVDGAIYLDAAKTSPYRMYQYLLNVPDDDAGPLLRMLTLVDVAEIDELVEAAAAEPQRRISQRVLARKVVEMVHGGTVIAPIEAVSSVLFGGEPPSELDDASWDLLAAELDEVVVDAGSGVLDIVAAATRDSRGRIKKNPDGYQVWGASGPVRPSSSVAAPPDPGPGGRYLVRRGRKDAFVAQIPGW